METVEPSVNLDSANALAVSTLPIRNGNRSALRVFQMTASAGVSTLPIRNGNPHVWRQSYGLSPVSTLPIRNGNHSAKSIPVSTAALCKYLTYKEWKLDRAKSILEKLRKYLTYKEWKRFLRCYLTSLSFLCYYLYYK